MSRSQLLTLFASPALLTLLAPAASCTPPARPPARLAPPPTIASYPPVAASSAPSASAAASAPTAPSAEPAEPAAPPEVIAKLSDEQRRELADLTPLCPTAIAVVNGKLSVGCTCCPSGCGPTADSTPRLRSSTDALIEPLSRLAGSFTAVGAAEHVVFMDTCSCDGCAHNAHLESADGSGGLVETQRLQVIGGSACKLVRRKGQVDRALCERFRARAGYAATTLYLYELSGDPPTDTPLEPLFEFSALDDLLLRCMPKVAFVSRTLDHWKLEDVDRDGQDDLVVDVTVRDGVVTPALFAACDPDDSAAKKPELRLPPARSMKLTWTATPRGFAPTAATRKLLKQLDAAKAKEGDE